MRCVMDIRGNAQSLEDTPCIGICSATQWGDAICRGCGRTTTEIRDWSILPTLYKKLAILRAVDEGYTPRSVYVYKNDPDLGRVCVFAIGSSEPPGSV